MRSLDAFCAITYLLCWNMRILYYIDASIVEFTMLVERFMGLSIRTATIGVLGYVLTPPSTIVN